MTPPYLMWTLCDAMTFARSVLSRNTAAEVSSHDDSMPKMVMFIFGSVSLGTCFSALGQTKLFHAFCRVVLPKKLTLQVTMKARCAKV